MFLPTVAAFHRMQNINWSVWPSDIVKTMYILLPPPPPLTLSLSLCDDSVLLQEWITINRDYGTNMLTERFLLTYQSLQRSYVYHVFFLRVWPWRNQRGHLHYAPMLGSGGCGLLCLHLRSRPCMYQKFCIIFVLNTSFVSCTSRPQLCIPDDR